MKTVRYDHRQHNPDRYPGLPRTSGIYGLCTAQDPRVRYIGSSVHIERRLYEHVHLLSNTPNGQWLSRLRVLGVHPCALVLQEGDLGLHHSEARKRAEAEWIEHFHMLGEADLNVHLTPDSHEKGQRVSRTPLKYQIGPLNRRIAELEQEVVSLKAQLEFLRGENAHG